MITTSGYHFTLSTHPITKRFLSFFLLVWPPRSQSLLIMGWCSSIPEHRLWLPLDSVPYIKCTIFTVRWWFWYPCLYLSFLFPFLPPPWFSRVPCPLQFDRFLSVSFASSPSMSLVTPPTHTKAKYHQPHRAVTHQKRGAPEPHTRSGLLICLRTPEEATGGTHQTDNRESNDAGGGGRLMTRTERRQRIQRGNGRTAGDPEPGRIREGKKRGKGKRERETGGPEPPSDGKDSPLNIRDGV